MTIKTRGYLSTYLPAGSNQNGNTLKLSNCDPNRSNFKVLLNFDFLWNFCSSAYPGNQARIGKNFAKHISDDSWHLTSKESLRQAPTNA